jgi:PAS domain S-box-containing protein
LAKARILIVEDEVVIAQDIRASLAKLGYEPVKTVVSAEESIKEAQLLKPDLILMDIALQGPMDGIEAADRIQVDRKVPIIYLTAYVDDRILERAKKTGPFAYIIKPFEHKELHFAIEMALYKHGMEEKLRISREQYRSIVEMANIIPWEMDRDTGRFTYMGPQVEKTLGYPVREWSGFDFLLSHIHPEDRGIANRLINSNGPNADEQTDIEFRMFKADETIVWFRTAGEVSPDNGSNSIVRCVMLDITRQKHAEEERERLILELKDALSKIKTLRGLVPICAWCKNIRDDKGFWSQVEIYIKEHSDVEFTHGICPECTSKLSNEMNGFNKS